jgi:hypothetical protein
MGLQEITLQTLNDFDCGRVAVAFNAELKKVVEDLRDRAGDKSKRTVTLTVGLTPQPTTGGDCETALVGFAVHSKIPVRSTRDYEVKVRANNALVVNAESPTDVRQGTIDQELERKRPAEPGDNGLSDEAQERMRDA